MCEHRKGNDQLFKGTKKSFTKEVTSKLSFEKFIKSISGRKEDDEGMLLQVKRARQKHTDVKDHGLETEFSVTGPD